MNLIFHWVYPQSELLRCRHPYKVDYPHSGAATSYTWQSRLILCFFSDSLPKDPLLGSKMRYDSSGMKHSALIPVPLARPHAFLCYLVASMESGIYMPRLSMPPHHAGHWGPPPTLGEKKKKRSGSTPQYCQSELRDCPGSHSRVYAKVAYQRGERHSEILQRLGH